MWQQSLHLKVAKGCQYATCYFAERKSIPTPKLSTFTLRSPLILKDVCNVANKRNNSKLCSKWHRPILEAKPNCCETNRGKHTR